MIAKISNLDAYREKNAISTPVKTDSATNDSNIEIVAMLQEIQAQNEYIIQLAESQAKAIQDRSLVTTSTISLTPSGFAGTTSLKNIPYSFPSTTADVNESKGSEQGIPLYRLLEVGSFVWAVLAIASLAFWGFNFPPLLNPFVSLLVLVASPFFFFMGRTARGKRS